MAHLRDQAEEEGPIFLALTETWLNENILDAEIQINGYQLFRKDRDRRICGGVAIYIMEKFAVREIWSFSNGYSEAILVEMTQLKLILALVYRPPNCPLERGGTR